MSKKLAIIQTQDWKSFKSNAEKPFEVNLEGDLIIITGTNGSGKSQLLDVIKMVNVQNTGQPGSLVSIDGVPVSSNSILKKSFKEIITVQPIAKANTAYIDQISNEILSKINNQNTYPEKARSFEKFQKITGPYNFNNDWTKVRDMLTTKVFTDFVWQSDDIFNFDNLYELIRI